MERCAYNGSIEKRRGQTRGRQRSGSHENRIEGCQVSEGAVTKRDKYTRERTDFDVAHKLPTRTCPGRDEKRGAATGLKRGPVP